MPSESLSCGILLPELKFTKDVISIKKRHIYCEKESEFKVCPKCATKSSTIYERVAKYTNSSSWLVYKSFYEQVDLELRKYKSPWPKTTELLQGC